MLFSYVLSVLAVLAAPSWGLVFWPISTPSADSPWVIGQPNAISWISSGDTGVQIFDIQLHNWNKTVMVGFIELVQRVPQRAFTSGTAKGRMGGELAVNLGPDIPTGDGFSLVFLDTGSGIVYAKSKKFSIYPAAAQPGNYTTATMPDGMPATTVTITATPDPTQQYLLTLDGVPPTTATTTVQIAGNAGSGSS